jgi:hypothetical protein
MENHLLDDGTFRVLGRGTKRQIENATLCTIDKHAAAGRVGAYS